MNKKAEQWNLPHPVSDSHFHLREMRQKGFEIPRIVAEAFARGLAAGMDVAVDESGFAERVSLAQSLPGIRLSAGIHPSSAGGPVEDRMTEVRRQAAHPLVTAIGETGLDFFRDGVPRSVQEEWFSRHLNLSRETDLPVIIHNREADRRVLELVEREQPAGGVLHCFSSPLEVMEGGLSAGLFISFAGNITYRRSEWLREVAALVPKNRLLVETDSPYLSPQEVRGRPNHPGHIGFTVKVLAEIRGEDPEETARITMENARRLFGLNIST